jgi:hypothetical protein
MKIIILTNQTPLHRGWNDFYPLLKWKKQFLVKGISFRFVDSIEKINSKNSNDIIIIDYRYIRLRLKYDESNLIEKDRIIADVLIFRKTFNKIILFDSGDSTGSRLFWLTPYVDIHLKKQLLKDRSIYLKNDNDKSVMIWLPEVYESSGIDYVPINETDLIKLKLSWNLGMLDYRYFPYSKHYPIGTSCLFNSLYKKIKFSNPTLNKEILAVQRGCLRPSIRYSFQRKILQSKLMDLKSEGYPVRVGGSVSKKDYMKEIRNSKAIVSAYGWGEVCYRDFEAIQSGCLLIKPSMDHVETFPDIYIKNQTYISVGWNLEGLEDALIDIDNNYHCYLKIVQNAQKVYKNFIDDGDGFVNRFIELIN